MIVVGRPRGLSIEHWAARPPGACYRREGVWNIRRESRLLGQAWVIVTLFATTVQCVCLGCAVAWKLYMGMKYYRNNNVNNTIKCQALCNLHSAVRARHGNTASTKWNSSRGNCIHKDMSLKRIRTNVCSYGLCARWVSVQLHYKTVITACYM